MSNLAQALPIAQGEVVRFPKKERNSMSKKEEGYTRLPNALIDSQIMAQLSDKAFKCLLLIIRQTLGFDRVSHAISITQFQKYCGIKKRDTVMSSIKELEELKIIAVERKLGCLSTYFLTFDQYQQTGPVPLNGTSTTKQHQTSTIERDTTSTVERDTNKENIKEKLNKDNSNNPSANFEPQNRPMLQFVEYHPEDKKIYSLRELTRTYPAQSDFTAQAKVSFPKLTDDEIWQKLCDIAQWSVDQPARTAQKWMSTWLTSCKNIGEKKPAQPKAKAKQPEKKKYHRYGQGVINP